MARVRVEMDSRLRATGDVDVEPLVVHVVSECRRLVVVHPGDCRPLDRVGRDTIVKLNEEARDVLLVLVEPERERTVATTS